MGNMKKRPKVGLALSSGAARGLAHLGVLEVLEKEAIPIDMVTGTSAGALIGALYALKRDAAQVRDTVIELTTHRFLLLVADLGLPRTGLVRGRKLTEQLRTVLGDVNFEDLAVPFACIATDIGTGGEVVLNRGSVVEAVRASTSIPGIFSVVKWEGRYLVDGGLVNPVPVQVLRDMGADLIIAVNVVPDMRHRVHPDADEMRAPNILNVLLRTIHIAGYQAVRSSLDGADVIIEPEVAHIGFGEFRINVRECIHQGRLAARKATPEIRRLLATSPAHRAPGHP